jgi:hypothetical protein
MEKYTILNSYAEYLVVRAEQIVMKPKNMPWEVAGGFSGNGQAHTWLCKNWALARETRC